MIIILPDECFLKMCSYSIYFMKQHGGDGCGSPTCDIACTVLGTGLRWSTASFTQTRWGRAVWGQRSVRRRGGGGQLQTKRIQGCPGHRGLLVMCPPTRPSSGVVAGGFSKRDCKHQLKIHPAYQNSIIYNGPIRCICQHPQLLNAAIIFFQENLICIKE